MNLNDRLLKIDDLCGSAHALLNQIATRDAAAYPLPPHLDSKVTGAIAQLTEARDVLNDLAVGDSKKLTIKPPAPKDWRQTDGAMRRLSCNNARGQPSAMPIQHTKSVHVRQMKPKTGSVLDFYYRGRYPFGWILRKGSSCHTGQSYPLTPDLAAYLSKEPGFL